MKKSVLALGAAVLAMGSVFAPNAGRVGSNAPTTVRQNQGQRAQQNAPQPSKLASTQINEQVKDRYRPTGYGLIRNDGMSRKDWGQHLQRTGRQRWTKAKRRIA